MTLNRYAAKRDQTETQIIEALRRIGATVYPLSDAGLPDLIVGYRQKTYLLECKSGKNKLNERQCKFFEEWRGGACYIVRDMKEALIAVGALCTRS